MRHSVLILAVILIVPICSTSQESIEHDGKKYYYKTLFEDDFNDNKNNWQIVSEGKEYSKVENGNFTIYSEKPNWSKNYIFPTELDLSKFHDFEIGVSVKKLKENGDFQTIQIYWNAVGPNPNSFSRHQFVLMNDGYYLWDVVYKQGKKYPKYDYVYKSPKGVFGHSKLNEIGFTTLKIRKIGRVYYFYLDDYLLFSQYQPKVYLEQHKINLVVDNMSIEVDKVYLKELTIQPPVALRPVMNNTPNDNPSSELVNLSESKKNFYALIIGNNNYQDPNLSDLDQPISDATKVYNVLTTKYTFEPQNVTFLKDATRETIIGELDKLSNGLTANDNLLIFYAGHGQWNEKKETGYWLPVDAKQNITADWLRNSTLQEYIDDIEAKHTLLIADACFGGGIFKTRAAFNDASRSINNLYKNDSRKAMTSGMLNEVPDKSVFVESLVMKLDQNEEKYLPSMNLFMQFRENVMNNSYNAPQYGTIHNTGDKGGDFIFIRRTE